MPGSTGVQSVDGADKVYLNLGREVLGAERFGRRFQADAGAGHQQIDGAKPRFQLRHHLAHGREIGDIGDGAGDGFALEFSGEAVETLAMAIEGGDVRALGGEAERELPPDTAGRSRYQGDAIGEGFHAASVGFCQPAAQSRKKYALACAAG